MTASIFDEHAAWYLSRSAGMVAFALLSLSIALGLLFSGRTRYPAPGWALSVHRHASSLAVATTVVHVVVLLADPWLAPSIKELLVPGASEWKTAAVTFGQVGLYLLLVTQASGYLRGKMPAKTWHLIHLLSFPAWGAALTHYLQAGSDADTTPATVFTIVCCSLVGASVFWRLGASAGRAGRRKPANQRTTEPGAATSPPRPATSTATPPAHTHGQEPWWQTSSVPPQHPAAVRTSSLPPAGPESWTPPTGTAPQPRPSATARQERVPGMSPQPDRTNDEQAERLARLAARRQQRG